MLLWESCPLKLLSLGFYSLLWSLLILYVVLANSDCEDYSWLGNLFYLVFCILVHFYVYDSEDKIV